MIGGARFARPTLPFLAAFAAAVLAAAAAARAEQVGDILVDVQPSPVVIPGPFAGRFGGEEGVSHGYVEHRVRLKNMSPKDHTVELVCPAAQRLSARIGTASRTVRVMGGQEAFVSLYETSDNALERFAMEVRVDGARAEQPIYGAGLAAGFRGSGPGEPPRPAVLLSPGIPQDIRDRARVPVASEPETPGEGAKPTPPDIVPMPAPLGALDQMVLLRSDVPVSQWSPNWLGYSCYDAILLTQREAEEMPAAVQLALRRYIECGGVLVVHGRKLPEAFSRDGAKDSGGIFFCVGLGRVAASAPDGEPSWEQTAALLPHMGSDCYRPFQRPPDPRDLLVAQTSVPVRGLFLLVLVFGVAIGPVNVWLLARYRRRIWLWWNVPAISALTCLAVFCYAMFSEGWTPRGKTATITVLDERCHRATTVGYVSYYCPLTPSDGFHFAADTDVALLAREGRFDYRYSPYRGRDPEEGGPRFVDWTSDQHLTSGWASARVPAYFQIRKNEDRRERLTIESTAGGGLKVVNALGADIRRLYVADAAGQVFEGQDIPAGAERTLAPVAGAPKAAGGPPEACRLLLTSGLLDYLDIWSRRIDPARPAAGVSPARLVPRPSPPEREPWNYLANLSPGGYVAVLDHSPFVEPSLAGAKCEDTVAIVRGISKGPDHER
jgi:hypothetical protein